MSQQFRRVFELAQQADLIQWDTLPSGAKTPDHESVAKAQKFAELIVRECVNIVNSLEQHEGPGDCSTAEYIKDHFGVES